MEGVKTQQMTSDRDKCGLGSLLPMSCRGRAEAFARSLHSRLRTLNTQDNGVATESSWLTGHEPALPSLTQPQAQSRDVWDIGLESPGSPDDELENSLEELINNDSLKHSHSQDCHCSKPKDKKPPQVNGVIKKTLSVDSDSDCSFYDPENDFIPEVALTNGFSHSSEGSPEQSLQSEDVFESTVELTCNLSEDSSSLSELNRDCETYTSSLSVPQDLTVDLTVELAVPVPVQNGFDTLEELPEEDQELTTPPRVRRCSSLKTGKTPPGTPGSKKIVRFADCLGLDLADVRTFLDEIPKIPTSAYDDLPNADLSDSGSESNLNILASSSFQGVRIEKVVVPMFQQPGGLPNFLDKVRERNVCLENAVIDDPVALSIVGSVRVKNLDFHKSVHIRYSTDSWQTFADVQGVYVQNSCDGFSDRFTFMMYANALVVGQRMEFAVRFQCRGCQYWDNNNGANYVFQCLPASNTAPYVPIVSHVEDSWGAASFY